MAHIQLTDIRGSQTVNADVDDQEPLRLSDDGPLFDVDQIEVIYERRDVRWRQVSVKVTGYFHRGDAAWAPDALTVTLTTPFFSKWITEFVLKHQPGVQ
jgi:hypothetical protein